MTKETYEKASKLANDIKHLDNIINDFDDKSCWIKVITPYHKENIVTSMRFQNELLKWLRVKREEYYNEFEELQ